MSYTVTYGESQNYPAAWRDCRAGGKLYVSQSPRLSPKIKRAIVEDIIAVRPLSNEAVSDIWDRLPVSKWEDVTICPKVVTNEDEPTDYTVSTDYTHTRGCGDMEPDKVMMLR